MKFNWGTGIVIAIAAFMGFIIYLVVNMTVGEKFKYDLVTEKYYQKELTFEAEFTAEQNAKNLKEEVTVTKIKEGLKIEFPTFFNPEEIQGKVFLYRPSNKQLDFEIPISTSNTYLLVPEKRLLGGRWNIAISMNYKNKTYLFKKELVY